eukprot:CAMPEP_0171931098 /NCGR_PEP_ID=MMETSP0993-20121228/29147_1 /TAXON_ID=483369 /ORGANISM="non described non described, Strain CCMP2098" /LENGTH=683 /DNA_ID=CAMNT_0012571047 /DNA_START=52 /DNA_END=2103 /DNA_ORIENTATION=+
MILSAAFFVALFVESDSLSPLVIPATVRTNVRCCSSIPVQAGEGAPILPAELIAGMGGNDMLPVQRAAYDLILEGQDTVIHSPTGTGKTWAFALPLAARLLAIKNESGDTSVKRDVVGGAPANKGRSRRKKESCVSPRVVVVAPSRELAKQVGKEFSLFVPSKKVCTVFGGVPLERHSNQLRTNGGADVVVATAGRLRELIREEHLDFKRLGTLVLDEADVLLNAKDQPEVKQFLDDMQHDYQLVLCSATINAHVRKFAKEVMELTDASPNFVTIKLDDAEQQESGETAAGSEDGVRGLSGVGSRLRAPTVNHWSLAAGADVRCGVAADLVATMGPRTTIVFVKTKVECEKAAAELSQRLGGQGASVHVLHGDIPQPVRSRTIALLRTGDHVDVDSTTTNPRILVATDVAARGLDLPGVDLVLQFGVPRKQGKDGTFDPELYTHRTGRAGRIGGGEANVADAVLLFDPADGEAALLGKLALKLPRPIGTKTPPSSLEVMEAAFSRAEKRCAALVRSDQEHQAKANESNRQEQGSLVSFFAEKLATPGRLDGEESELVRRLAGAMVALSGLDSVPTPRSLITASPADRTIRVTKASKSANDNDRDDGGDGDDDVSGVLSPAEVTRLCKSLGSGKLGRVTVLADGSAVFDMPAAKAARLVETANSAATGGVLEGGWLVELPMSLP